MISKWTASVQAEPGFLHTVIEAMALYPSEERDINIIIDGMAIKKSKLWDNSSGKFIGYPDYGCLDYGSVTTCVKKNENLLATEALVFTEVKAFVPHGNYQLHIFFKTKLLAHFKVN